MAATQTIIASNKKPSALDQARNLLQQAGSAFGNAGNFVQENVVWPIQKLNPQYQKNIQSAKVNQLGNEVAYQIGAGSLRYNPSSPTNSYTYGGLMNPAPSKAVPVSSQRVIQQIAQQPRKPVQQVIQQPVQRLPSPTPTQVLQPAKKSGFSVVTPTPTPNNVPINPQVASFIETTILPITRQYGIPDAIAAGQFAAEGRLQGLGAARNNYYNIAAGDSNPNAAFSYATPEAGVEAYAKYLAGQLTNSKGVYQYPSEAHRQQILNAYQQRNDVMKYLQAIQNNGYAGDPATYSKRASAINPATGKKYKSYSDFISNTPEFQRYFYAQK